MQDHDVLIIGAGLAGMRAALSAKEAGADVAVVSKVHPVRSHSNAAQGGINAALTDRGDDWRDHAYATIKGSEFLGDQDAIEVMCREAGSEVLAMEHIGAIFNRVWTLFDQFWPKNPETCIFEQKSPHLSGL